MAVLLDPEPTGPRRSTPQAGANGARAADPARPRDARCAACAASRASRCARCARCRRPSPASPTCPGANALPGRADALATSTRAVRRTLGSDESTGVLEVTKARPPKTPFNGPVSAHRRFAFGSLSLDAVRQVRREFGTTVNDVVVTLCAGAVRDWLMERDALPEDPLVAMIPMSVRKRDERGAWGNRISMMIVPIPTNEPDPAHAPAAHPRAACAAPRSATARCPPRC